ncbi:hypothetical protein HDR67_01945 [bacterium]|nr:hypothetical protein [bacterium]
MKKVFIILLLSGILVLTGCASKKVPAEITIIDANQEEIPYQIHSTEDQEEVKKIFNTLKSAKTNNLFNGVSIHLNSAFSGKAIINNSSTIDLGYTIKAEAEANFKQYRMSGNVSLDGFTNTESESLSLHTKNSFSLNLFNDDSYLYIKGKVNTGSNSVTLKNKINIESFTQEKKALIQNSIDLLKYYKVIDLIEDIDHWIEVYHIVIVDTRKESFTIQLHISSEDLFPEISVQETIDVDIEIGCDTLLPVGIEFTADKVIEEALRNQYVKDYFTEDVQIQNPKFSISLEFTYGHFTIQEVSDTEKELYKQYQ